MPVLPSIPYREHAIPSLHSQLVLADETSLSILGGGTAAIDEFYQFWSNAQLYLQHAVDEQTIDIETLSLAHEVAGRVEFVADRLVIFYEEMEALSASFTEMETLFMELSLEDRDISTSIKREESTKLSPLPSYIKPAYNWLLKNLHNPYPSKHVKSAIAVQTSTSLGYIDSWFTDVRRRIGWTTLCKQHFSNKRALIVQAATRFFQNAPLVLNLSLYPDHRPINTNYDVDFNQIESNVKDLYAGKFDRTRLITTLDASIKDLTPEIQARVQLEYSQRKANPALSYPSPSPSPQSYPSDMHPSNSVTKEQRTSYKRRNSRPPDSDDDGRSAAKRSRLDSSPTTDDISIASLPSPTSSIIDLSAKSVDLPLSSTPLPLPILSPGALCGKRKRQLSDVDGVTPSSGPSLPLIPDVPVANSAKRKRRLSDANDQMGSRRPHNSLIAPRLQTVSDPSPASKPASVQLDFDLWWSGSLLPSHGLDVSHVPSLQVVEKLDDSTPLDIHYQNYTDLASSIPDFDLWPEYSETSINASTCGDTGEALPSNPADSGVDNVMQDSQHASFFPHDSALNLNINDCSIPYPTTILFPNIDRDLGIDQNLSISSFYPDLSWISSWNPQNDPMLDPQLYGNPLPQFVSDFPSAIPQFHDPYALDDNHTKHERLERLREELRQLEADLVLNS